MTLVRATSLAETKGCPECRAAVKDALKGCPLLLVYDCECGEHWYLKRGDRTESTQNPSGIVP